MSTASQFEQDLVAAYAEGAEYEKLETLEDKVAHIGIATRNVDPAMVVECDYRPCGRRISILSSEVEENTDPWGRGTGEFFCNDDCMASEGESRDEDGGE